MKDELNWRVFYLYHDQKYLEEENGKIIGSSSTNITLNREFVWTGKTGHKNYEGLFEILQFLQGSHLDNFLLKTLKLGWVAFHSSIIQLKCFDFQSNQCKNLPQCPHVSAMGCGLWHPGRSKAQPWTSLCISVKNLLYLPGPTQCQ